VGVTLLPKAVVAAAVRQGLVAIHELSAEDGEVETLFIRRRDSYVSSALSAFLGIVQPLVKTQLVAGADLKATASKEKSRTFGPSLHTVVA
jgi:DNA-binding transcriptional LysR family regulator